MSENVKWRKKNKNKNTNEILFPTPGDKQAYDGKKRSLYETLPI